MRNKLMKVIVPFSYVIRGIIYIITGLYGLFAAIGLVGNIKDTANIVRILSLIPFGKVILVVVFLGFLGYGFWGLFRALFDPLKKGMGAKGLISRIGYLTSGLSYLGLSILPIHILFNMTETDSSNSRGSARILFRLPGGFILVTIIGVVIIIGGFSQIIYGFRESFKKSLQPMQSGKHKKILQITGVYGYIARGITYSLIGVFFLKAGLSRNAGQAKDLGDILLWTWQLYGGAIILGLISSGLIALGIYSVFASPVIKLKNVKKI